jgi:hypothetical protein
MLLLASALDRSRGEDSWCKEREDGKVRAGDEASIGDADSGHGRMEAQQLSCSHDVVVPNGYLSRWWKS